MACHHGTRFKHLFSDPEKLPERWYAAQSGRRNWPFWNILSGHPTALFSVEGHGALYVHCPFSINSHYGTDLLTNQMICLKGDPELLSHTCEHGEAEMRALFWAGNFSVQTGTGHRPLL